MPIVTPDVEAAFIARAIALVPTLFSTKTLLPGPEVLIGGVVPAACGFVRHTGERRQLHFSGQRRELGVQLLQRFARDGWTPTRRAEAYTAMRATYDALHLSGPFTVAAVTYDDIRAVDAPNELQPAYFAMNFSVFYRS